MKYDLEQRTLAFAVAVRSYVRQLMKKTGARVVLDDMRQLIRSSGSVGANYIEANEAYSKKDYFYRVAICRKEVKESIYWLKLIFTQIEDEDSMRLVAEAEELMKIFGTILKHRSLR